MNMPLTHFHDFGRGPGLRFSSFEFLALVEGTGAQSCSEKIEPL